MVFPAFLYMLEAGSHMKLQNTQIRAIIRLFVLIDTMLFASFADAEQQVKIDLNSIIHLTFDHNLEILAARYDRDAANLQFELFEKRMSQFTPLLVESEYQLENERFTDPIRNRYDQQASVAVGTRKEFFDGTEIQLLMGQLTEIEDGASDSNAFVDIEVSKPLFGSNQRLERIIERNFEENERLSSNLEFVDLVRELILDNQLLFCEIQEQLSVIESCERAIADLEQLTRDRGTTIPESDRLLIRNEQEDYRADMVEEQSDLGSLFFELGDQLGLEDIDLQREMIGDYQAQISRNQYYLANTPGDLYEQSEAVDVEIKILEIAARNAQLKQKLAAQGRWDIIGTLFSRYEPESSGRNSHHSSEFQLGAAMQLSIIDPKMLLITKRQANAEEMRYVTLIRQRKRSIRNGIRANLSELKALNELLKSLESSKNDKVQLYDIKRASYLNRDESLENLIDARHSLYQTETQIAKIRNNFYERRLALDEVTGLYYQLLSFD